MEQRCCVSFGAEDGGVPSSCLAASLADHSIAFFGMGDGSVAQFVLDRTSGAVLSRGHSEGLAQLFKRMQTMFLKMPTHTHTHARARIHRLPSLPSRSACQGP